MWISRLYILFVGIILTLTTGFGIAAFYPEPQRPSYPVRLQKPIIAESCYSTPEKAQTPECQQMLQEREADEAKFQAEQEVYNVQNARYTRTTIFFGISIGALFTIVGLGVLKTSRLIAHGLLLAGVLTMILTRFTVMLASLGAPVTSTAQANPIAYMQFGVLVLLSAAVVFIGLKALKEE